MNADRDDRRDVRRTLRAWQLASLAFLAVSTYVLLTSLELGYRDATGPGPGFFPVWVGALGVVTAVALLATLRLRVVARYEAWRWPEREAAMRIAVTVLAVAFVAALLERLGYRLAMVLFLAVLLHCFGLRSWWRIAVAAIIGSLATHFIFYRLLKVQLPTGLLGW